MCTCHGVYVCMSHRKRPPVEAPAPRSTFLGAPMTAAEENTLLHYAGHCHDGANCPACDTVSKYMGAYLEANARAEEAEYRLMRADAFANSIIEG